MTQRRNSGYDWFWGGVLGLFLDICLLKTFLKAAIEKLSQEDKFIYFWKIKQEIIFKKIWRMHG